MTALTLIGEPFPDWEQDLHRAAASDLAAAVGASAPRSCSARLFVARDREVPVFASPRVQAEAIPMKAAVMPFMWQAGTSARPLDGEFVHALTPMMPLRARGEDDGSQSSLTVPHAIAWEAPELMGTATARLYRAFVKRAAKYADVIVTPTHATARVLHEHYGADLPVQVMPLAPPSVLLEPVDAPDRRERLGLPEDYVVTTATDTEHGRLAWVFDALRADPSLPDLVVLDEIDPASPNDSEGTSGNSFSRAGIALGSLIRGRGGAKPRRRDPEAAEPGGAETTAPAIAAPDAEPGIVDAGAAHTEDVEAEHPGTAAEAHADAGAADAASHEASGDALAYSAHDSMFIDPAEPSRADVASDAGAAPEFEAVPEAEEAPEAAQSSEQAATASVEPSSALPEPDAAISISTADAAIATQAASESAATGAETRIPADLRGRVHVVRTGDLADVAAALAGAKLLLQPQAVSGTGYLLLAALAADVPVLYAESEANAEITLDGGLAVGDSAEFASVLSRLLGDAEELSRLAVLAGDRGRTFSWDGTAWQLWELHANL